MSVPDPPTFADHDEFDRPSLHVWARELLDDLQLLMATLQDCRDQYAGLLQEAHRTRRDSHRAGRLRRMSLEEAARGARIPVQALLDQGLRTALDLVRLDPGRLEEIPGIGERTAPRILDLISRLQRLQVDDLRPAADPASWSRNDIKLIGSLELWSWLAVLLGSPQVAAVLQLMRTLRFIKRWTSWLGWLFSSPSRRGRLGSSYLDARNIAWSAEHTATIDRLRQAYQQALRYAEQGVTEEEVIETWRDSSADLLARLEGFVAERGTVEERETIGLALGLEKLAPDLVRQIELLHLDTGLLIKTLRAYQVLGAKFAVMVRRGLLGDDVGLGKTIEAIAAIAHVISTEHDHHHIVVCPAQLVDNWLRECGETMPTVPREAFREPGRDAAFRRWTANGGILIVSYNQAGLLAERELPVVGFVVADEAHYVKNPESQRTEATSQLIAPSRRAVLMGGTLLENRAKELMDVAALVDPVKGPALRQQFGDGNTAHLHPDDFRKALSELYLRRNQQEVLKELPPILWTDEPISVDAASLEESQRALNRQDFMNARRVLTTHHGARSAKMERLREIIRECREEERKLLIFSYFRDAVDLAADIIGEGSAVIRGGVRQNTREQLMDTFRQTDGFAALSMQIKTGGEGLNLPSASVVVLMEPQFTPSMEAQAVGRAHRPGQTNPVVVHRLIALNSVDERIVELSGFKAELFNRLARRSPLADALEASRDVIPQELLRDDSDDHAGPEDDDDQRLNRPDVIP